MGAVGQDGVVVSGASEAFKTRMEAQCKEIQRYRSKVMQEGRELTLDQAAREWVESYAEAFERDNNQA